MSLCEYRDLTSLNDACIDAITELTWLRDVLDEINKTVSARRTRECTEIHNVHSAQSNAAPITLHIGDYVVIRTHT